MKTFLHLGQYLAECFLEWENCKYNCREYKNTHFIFDNVFEKSCRFWDNVEKRGGTREATDDDMAHALCVLDN